jgi:hypothetical protein
MDYDGDGKSFYDGDWINNVRHGWGTRQYPSGNIYQGMWFNNVRHGEGTMKWVDRDQIYTGQWENGIQVKLYTNYNSLLWYCLSKKRIWFKRMI